MLQILLALPYQAVIAGLVLGAHQTVRAPTFVGRAVHVAPVPSDRFLYMPAIRFTCLEGPDPLAGVDQELAQFSAAVTLASGRASASPIAGCFEGKRYSRAEMFQAACSQSLNGSDFPGSGLFGQLTDGGQDDSVHAIDLRPSQ